MSLFRAEALNAQTSQLEGQIVLVRSISSWVIVWAVAIFLIIVITFLCAASFTKRTTAVGILVPGEGAIPIMSPTPGRVVALQVQEGDEIRKGQTIFRISSDKALSSNQPDGSTLTLAQTQTASLLNQVESLEAEKQKISQLATNEMAAKRSEIVRLKLDLEHVKSQIGFNTERILASKERLEGYKKLNETLIVSNLTVQDQQDAVSALNVQTLTYRRQQNEIERNIISLESEIEKSPEISRLKILSLDREITTVRQKISDYQAQKEWAITSPVDGKVTAITGLVGQNAGSQVLAIVIPSDGELTAHLYVTSKQVGFMKSGQSARLRYQAFPYQKFGQYNGKIVEVAKSPLPPNSIPATLPIKNDEGLYKVSVKLDDQSIRYQGKEKPLVSGMLLEADVKQEKRRLIEWIVEPLYTLSKYN